MIQIFATPLTHTTQINHNHTSLNKVVNGGNLSLESAKPTYLVMQN